MRTFGIAVATLLLAAVAYLVGPDTLVDCDPSNPWDRFGTWVAQGAHVDGAPGIASCRAPAAPTWIVIGSIVGCGMALVLWSQRTREPREP